MISRSRLQEFVLRSFLEAARSVIPVSILEKAALPDWPGYEAIRPAAYEQAKLCTLFVDMRGSTVRALEVGAVSTFLTMHTLLPTVGYVVSQYRGIVPQYRGDGAISIFGLPVKGRAPAIGEAVQNAAFAAAGIQHAITEMVNPTLEKVKIAPVECGIGVDAGEVIVTRVVAPESDETLCFGESVNRASKLCDDARGGEVLITQTAARLWPNVEPGASGIHLGPRDGDVLSVPWRDMSVFID